MPMKDCFVLTFTIPLVELLVSDDSQLGFSSKACQALCELRWFSCSSIVEKYAMSCFLKYYPITGFCRNNM